MNLVCVVVANRVGTLEADQRLPLRLDAHVASCLRCQAVRARDRRLRRALSGLALQTVAAPRGLVASVEAAILEVSTFESPAPVVPDRHGGIRTRITSPGALAGVAAVAAGGAALAAWRLTRRPA